MPSDVPPTNWQELFSRWPVEQARRGVVIASFGEQIMFAGFATGERFLVLERQSPDAMGARTVILPYDQIQGLKLVDIVKSKTYQTLGFSTPTPK